MMNKFEIVEYKNRVNREYEENGEWEYTHPYGYKVNNNPKAVAILSGLNNYRRTHWLVRLIQDTRTFLKKKIKITIERN